MFRWFTEHVTEGTIQALAMIGIAIGGIIAGIQAFRSGWLNREKTPSTASSELRQTLAEIAAETRQHQRETQELQQSNHRELIRRVEDMDRVLSTVAERTAILVDRDRHNK